VAADLGCGWHPVMDAVAAYGQALVDDPARFGDVSALGLDETLRCRLGEWRRQAWTTHIVDVEAGQLLDVVTGRTASGPIEWLEKQTGEWRDRIRWATLDLSGPYRAVFDVMLPDAVQVADPFHLVRLANQKLDECRRRVQNETIGHRGRKYDPLYAKETIRSIYTIVDPNLAGEFVDQLIDDLGDRSMPTEVRSLGRTIARWRDQITAWHQARAPPTCSRRSPPGWGRSMTMRSARRSSQTSPGARGGVPAASTHLAGVRPRRTRRG
jgi:hypothetical protein